MDFLEADEKNKLLLLDYVNSNLEKINTLEELATATGHSNFKINKYIQEIKDDLNTLNGPVEYKGKIEYLKMNKKIYMELKIKYIKKSVKFKLFNEYLRGQVSLLKFAKSNFLSRSNVYEIKLTLQEVLDKYSITIEEGNLVGREVDIRKVAFDVYYYFFNGFPATSDKNIENTCNMMFSNILYLFELDLEYTKKVKLNIYIYILCIRTKEHNYLGEQTTILFSKDVINEYLKKKE